MKLFGLVGADTLRTVAARSGGLAQLLAFICAEKVVDYEQNRIRNGILPRKRNREFGVAVRDSIHD
jgi:hypothetical protein